VRSGVYPAPGQEVWASCNGSPLGYPPRMKLLWLGLGAAAAYVLLSKKEGSPAATVLTSTPVPGLAPTRTCAEWQAYSKSCADLAAMGASCEAWVGSVPQGCLPPPATPVPGLSTPSSGCPSGYFFDRTNGCVPSQPDAGFWNPEAEAMKQRIAEAELHAKAVLATATACCPQGRICIATMPLCKSGPNLLSAW